MSLHKLTAGNGYTYLTRQVAAMDASDRGYASLGDYYAQRGESPGVWMGRGLAGLSLDGVPVPLPPPSPGAPARASPGAVVSEAQMLALFGQGRHPDAEAIEHALAAAGHGPPAIRSATRLGSPYLVRDGATAFATRTAQAFAEYNATLGLPGDWPVPAPDRSRIRTRVADVMFAEQYGRAPLDARERSGFVARVSRSATTAVAGYDLTFSPVKSVSALWALAPREVMTTIEAAHAAAVADTVGWLEDHAVYTRTGRAGVQQVDVRGLLAVAFTHRDSRVGDPDLHTHVAISNKVQTLDGRWLALDGRTLHKLAVAASERYNTRLEAELVDRLGVAFAPRAGGDPGKRPVRELVGFDGPVPAVHAARDRPGPAGTSGTGRTGADLLAAWSARRSAIDACRGELAARFQADHGRPPTPVEAIHLAQQATLATRPTKHAPRTHAEQRAAWRQQAIAVLGGEQQLAALVTGVLDAGRARSPTRRLSWSLRFRRRRPGTDGGAPGQPPGREWVERTAATVLDTVQATRATWQEGHLLAEAHRRARADGVALGDLDAAVNAVVTQATGACIALGVPDPVTEPAPLRRRDGSSVYTVAGTQLYTSDRILAAERALLATAARTDGRRCSRAAVEHALLASTANGIELNPGQAHLVRELACSGARLQLALAPAGTGKTTALSVLTHAWKDDGGQVIGLAPSAAAAAVLRSQIDVPTDTLAKLIDSLDAAGHAGGRAPGWVSGIGPDTLVLIDEAGMAATGDLYRAVDWITGRGGSVRLIGDDQQLAAIGAGGVLRDIADVHGAVTLTHVVRFTDPAEGAASLALREGDPAALGFYLDHGRVHVGDPETATDQAYRAWAADRAAGVDAVMLAPTRDLAAALNARAQTDRLTNGFVTHSPAGPAAGDAPGPAVTLADGSQAGVGDVIITRANDRRLPISATDWVKNGDRWHVTRVHPDGTLDVTHLVTRRRARLPAGYVSAHVTLGYATTVHAAQGVTADVSHTVALGREFRQLLYVALTRGRTANHVYLAVAGDGDPHSVITRDALLPPTAADLLARILARDGAQTSATTTARYQAAPPRRLGDTAARYADAVSTAARHRLGPDRLTALDAAADAALPGLTEQPAWPTLQTHLALIAIGGDDPAAALGDAINAREVGTADDVAAVLDWRLDPTGHHGSPPGPLPWLPGLPTALATDPEWGAYLGQRADLVTTLVCDLVAQVTTWSATTAPAWAVPLLGRCNTDPMLLADLAVWRAATGVDEADRRPTGPAATTTSLDDTSARSPCRTAAETRHQDRLDRRVAAVLGDPRAAAARWAPLAETVCDRLIRDPFWPVLAERLTAASRTGIDVAPLLAEAAAERPLPDEHPAAALWWRLSRHLPTADDLTQRRRTAATSAPQTDITPCRHPVVTPADPVAPPAPTASAGEKTVVNSAQESAEEGVPRSRILDLNAQALEFFTSQYARSWAPAYLAGRLGTDANALVEPPRHPNPSEDATPLQGMVAAGYAPSGWTTLIDHLRHHGATDDELLAAGLATRTRHGTLIDRFRDRLILPIHGPDGVHGFVARRNPRHDHDSSGPKYLNTPTTAAYRKGDLLYGLTESTDALAAGARPVLVEGPLDAIAVTLAGQGRYVGLAPLGTALTDAQADLLRPYLDPGKPGAIVATDADTAGHTAAAHAYQHLTTRGDRPGRLTLPDGLDPADLLQRSGPTALRDTLDHPTDLATLLIDQRIDAFRDILRFAEGRVGAARAAAPVIAALSPAEWLPMAEHLAARTSLPAVTVALMVFDVGRTASESPIAVGDQLLDQAPPQKPSRPTSTPSKQRVLKSSPPAGMLPRPTPARIRPPRPPSR